MTRQSIIRILQVLTGTLLGLAIALVWLSSSRETPGELSGPDDYFLPSPLPAPDFALTAQSGERVTSGEFEEKILVVFFGYTYCPDICPLTLTHLTEAFRLMGEEGDRIQVLLVSVDPTRDTPDRLKNYLRNFHPSFLGLSGTKEEIQVVADAFGAYFKQVGAGESYTVDHTARTFVVGIDREIVLTFPITATPEEMARDLSRLLSRKAG